MNDYELIGRLADLDTRLQKLEGIEPAPQPQPATKPPRLIEAVEAIFKNRWAYSLEELEPILAREKRIAEAREGLLNAARKMRSNISYKSVIDAYDRAWDFYDAVLNEKE